MISVRPIKGAVLSRTGDAAGRYLLDVEVCETRFGINVLGDCEGDGGHGDGFAEEPAYALLAGKSEKPYFRPLL